MLSKNNNFKLKTVVTKDLMSEEAFVITKAKSLAQMNEDYTLWRAKEINSIPLDVAIRVKNLDEKLGFKSSGCHIIDEILDDHQIRANQISPHCSVAKRAI